MKTNINFSELLNSRVNIRTLKMFAIKNQKFELAAELRKIEIEDFPQTDLDKDARTFANNIQSVLKLVNIHVNLNTAYIIGMTVQTYSKKKHKFSIKDAANIMAYAKEYIDDEL